MCYANDFPDAWSGCDLIVGASSGVPIKRGVVEAIGAEAGLKTKKRKTAKSRKQLVVSEEPERVNPSIIRKEVKHPLILKIKVKTKVKPSVLQVPVDSFKGTSSVVVTSSAHGYSGSLNIVPQSPLGPSRCTRSKQKTVEEFVEREREGQGLFPSSSFYLFFTSPYPCLLFCCVCSFFIFYFYFFN